MDITKILEEELRRMLLHGEYSQDAANSQYNELMEQSRTHCDTISEQVSRERACATFTIVFVRRNIFITT